jgi:hypothetical protein
VGPKKMLFTAQHPQAGSLAMAPGRVSLSEAVSMKVAGETAWLVAWSPLAACQFLTVAGRAVGHSFSMVGRWENSRTFPEGRYPVV